MKVRYVFDMSDPADREDQEIFAKAPAMRYALSETLDHMRRLRKYGFISVGKREIVSPEDMLEYLWETLHETITSGGLGDIIY